MTLKETIGANIRRIRLDKKWPQEKLSVRAGMSLNFIGQLERGKMNISADYIERIAKALEVEPEELIKKID
jgi:transcriptional regulator with XRE-family HTH domain